MSLVATARGVLAEATWIQLAAALGIAVIGARAVFARKLEHDLTGEVVVITGAASGIGRLTALELARCGCRLALWDRNGKALEAVVKEVEALGVGEARAYVVDVTNRELVYQTGNRVVADFGRVDILINNAGIVSGKRIHENDDAMMEKTMQVNTIAHFWTIKAFLPKMLERNHGKIVTMASMAGIVGTAGLVDYSASKFGAVGIAESLAMELHHQKKLGVKSICICPFFIKTGMFEGVTSRYHRLYPILEPDYVARQVVKAIKRDKQLLILPTMCRIAPAIKGLLPASAAIWVMDLFKMNDSMNNFRQTRKN